MLKTRFQGNIHTKSPKYTVSPAYWCTILMHLSENSVHWFWFFPVSCPTVCLSGNRISVPSTDAKPGQREATLPADEEFRRKQSCLRYAGSWEMQEEQMYPNDQCDFCPVCDLVLDFIPVLGSWSSCSQWLQESRRTLSRRGGGAACTLARLTHGSGVSWEHRW